MDISKSLFSNHNYLMKSSKKLDLHTKFCYYDSRVVCLDYINSTLGNKLLQGNRIEEPQGNGANSNGWDIK